MDRELSFPKDGPRAITFALDDAGELMITTEFRHAAFLSKLEVRELLLWLTEQSGERV